MPTSYLPDNDMARVAWLNNFSEKLPVYAPALEIPLQVVNDTEADAAWFSYVIQSHFNAKQYQQTLTQFKDLYRHSPTQRMPDDFPVLYQPANLPPPPVRYGIFNRIHPLVVRIKKHRAYTTAMGIDLGIIAPKKVVDLSALKPMLTVTLYNREPHISWPRGHSHALTLYASRNETDYTMLGRFVSLKYIDHYPLPPEGHSAKWWYKGRYMLNGEEVGAFSDIVSIVVIKG